MIYAIDEEKVQAERKFSVLLEQMHNALVRMMRNVKYNGIHERKIYIGDYERLVYSFQLLERVFYGFKIITTHKPTWVEARYHDLLLGKIQISGPQIEFERKRHARIEGKVTELKYSQTFQFFEVFEYPVSRSGYKKEMYNDLNDKLLKAITELL